MPGRRVQPDNDFIKFDRAEVERSIPERFKKQALRYAQRLAVKTRTEEMTYAQLDEASDRVAGALLAEHGTGQESIGLLFEAGASLVVALLAALKAGKICVPVDPGVPPVRARALLRDAEARLLLTDRRTRERAPELTEGVCPWLDIEDVGPHAAGTGRAAPLSADTLACIVYTSGSTGQAKGVVHSHRTLLHQVMLSTNERRIAAEDRLGAIASPGAIFGMWFTLTAMLNGASLFPLDFRRERMAELFDWVAREEITVLAGGHAIAHGLQDMPGQEARQCPRLRLLGFGGEAVYRSDVEACLRRFPHAIVSVALATTETGVLARHFLDRDTPIPGHVVPIGYPAEDKEIVVLSEDGQDVGVDTVGEIAVRSRYLALGYWRSPELTAAAFQPDPAGGDCRLYRTGDLGSMRPDGCLVHLGRKDFQVKIRGYRVEIAEIEGALRSVPGVREAVVVVREDSAGGRRLVAHVVPATEPAPTVSRLRKAVADALPDYMVPSAFVTQDELPRTRTGKVDRLALPVFDPARPELESPYVASRDGLQLRLIRIWEETLRVNPVGIHDNFFDLGGHSLLTVRLFARLEQEFGVALPLATLFHAPTVEQLTRVIRQEGWSAFWSSLVPVQPRGSKPPLFAVPPGGDVVGYVDLARWLGSDQPFYGLQSRGLDGKQAPHTRIEDIAAHNLADLRVVQPHGPYFLLGACFGGIVAFEMAQQLHARGEKVALLALLEPTRPSLVAFPLRNSYYHAGYHIQRVLAPVRFVAMRMMLYGRELMQMRPEERRSWMSEKVGVVKEVIVQHNLSRGNRSEVGEMRVRKAHLLALRTYVGRSYSGEITLFQAAGRPWPQRLRAWCQLARGGLEVHTIPGKDSGDMLHEPNVGPLVEHLRACLRREGSVGKPWASPPGDEVARRWFPKRGLSRDAGDRGLRRRAD